MTTCPGVETLDLFLAERLGETERREIETHVETCKDCQKMLGNLIPPPEAPFLIPPSDDEDGEPPPFAPDGFKILKRLKPGGMGVVFLAEDLRLKMPVALKRVRQADAPPHLWERLRVEARAMARVRHPNIVQIHGVGEQDGLPFIVMEYMDGGNLATRLEDAGLPPPRDAARLVADLACAMHFAHQQGIIHRDLKPGNVLLAAAAGPSPSAQAAWAACVKISDFGLARILDEEGEDTGSSRSSAVAGTLGYMSPEAIPLLASGDGDLDGRSTLTYMSSEATRGKGSKGSTLSDVYGLGAILYKMLTGHPPYEGADAREILDRMKDKEVVRPRRLRGDIPADLELICLKCLEREPGRRYTSAEQLADELRRFLDNRPLRYTRLVGPAERLWRWGRRNPAWALAAGLAAVVLLVLVAGPSAFAIQEHRHLDAIGKSLREANLRLSERNLEEGLSLCEQGKVGVGLLKLAEALQSAPPDADDLVRVIQANLAGWGRQVSPLRGYLAHAEGVRAVAFSSDGKRILTGGPDGIARLWDAQTCEIDGVPLPHGAPLNAVALSPDGKRAATAGSDGTARMWDVASGRSLGRLPHGSAVLAVAFGPGGTRILTGGADKVARVWDTETGELVGKPLDHGAEVYAVAFSPNGKTVATAGFKAAKLWEVATGALVGKELHHSGSVRALAFSSDSTKLLTGCWDSTARLWDVASGDPLGPPLRHRRAVLAVGFVDGGRVATASADGIARLWDGSFGWPLGQPLANAGDAQVLAFGPGGKRVVTVGADGATRLWGADPPPVLPHRSEVWAVAISPDARTILTGSADGTARFWDAATGKPLGPVLAGHQHAILCVAFSPDSRTAVTGGWDGTARLWDVASRAPLPNVQPLRHGGFVHGVAFAPNGKRVATASSDGTARLWDTASGADLGLRFRHAGGVGVVAFHPDGGTLLTAGADNAARLWDIHSGKAVVEFLGHRDWVRRAAFSPDGGKVVTGSLDGTARVWEVSSGKLLGVPVQYGAAVRVAAFSPDGRTVLTGSDDGTASLSDAESGLPRGQPLWLRNAVSAGAFSPDGRVVLTGSADTTAQFWDAASGRPLGPPLEHEGEVYAVAFHPDGHTVVTGSSGGATRLWRGATWVADDADRVRRWAQGLTGMELAPGGSARFLHPDRWTERRQEFPDGAGP
jgi:WD40 repeat protein/serine/threonine protein kinase